MVSRYRRIGSELFWVGTGQASAAVGTLISLRVLTSLLGPSVFGEVALSLTVWNLVSGVVFTGPGSATVRFFGAAQEENQLASFFSAAWKVLLQRTALFAIVLFGLLIGVNVSGYRHLTPLVLVVSVGAVVVAFSTILDGVQNAARQRVVVAWHNAIGQWLRFLFAAALVSLFGPSSIATLAGFSAAAIVVLTSQYLFFVRLARRALVEAPPSTAEGIGIWSQKMSRYAWPFAIFGIMGWVQSSSERWALQTFGDAASVGLYAALSQIGFGPVVLLSNVASQLVGPIFFSRVGSATDPTRVERTRRLNMRVILMFVLLGTAAVLTTLFFHRPILRLFVAPEFRHVSALLPVMTLSGGCYACSHIATYLFLSQTDTWSLLNPKHVSAVFATILLFVGAFFYSLKGVIWASAISSLFTLIALLAASQLQPRRKTIHS
jgi:O-antigen/teichoic acid export membrane protein